MPSYILTLRSPSHLADSKGEMAITDERPLEALAQELATSGYLRITETSEPIGSPARAIRHILFASAVESIREAD